MTRTTLCVIVAFLIGLTGGYLFYDYRAKRMPDTWFEAPSVPLGVRKSFVSYKTEALFDVDIALPKVESISSKVKLFPSRNGKKKLKWAMS